MLQYQQIDLFATAMIPAVASYGLFQLLTTACICAALTFNDILTKKLQAPTNQIDEKVLEEYSPEEYLKFQNDVPVGPEFE